MLLRTAKTWPFIMPFNAVPGRAIHRAISTASLPFKLLARKVLIIGSGGLSIGQAGEFDYSGSQAIKALKEEGVKTVLINPNIATVQTGNDLADQVYFVPVLPEYVEYVIQQERPDSILLGFGGQSALNCGIELDRSGILRKYGVKVLGTPVRTLEISEDRDLFAKALKEIGIPVARSTAVNSVEDALKAGNAIGYPVIVRAAYALGGLGSGFANNDAEMKELAAQSLSLSPQLLVERSMRGWKELEYEVVRDAENNCVTVCNMENFDPLGTHTGDSIVVAPSQTLSDREYHMLRSAAIKIICHLGVVGECNVQYGLHPTSLEYVVIEVNARLSRSSALASKATGYPLASVAAKISLGYSLPSITNAVTKTTTANFEPSLDYVVTKIPKWDLTKFAHVSRKIGSSMKSVGEVMAIGRTWEESLQKAVRMIDPRFAGFESIDFGDNLDEVLRNPTDQRLFAVASAMFHHGYTVDKIHELSKIDKWFLYKLQNIVNISNEFKEAEIAHNEPGTFLSSLTKSNFELAKKSGFSDLQIANLSKSTEMEVRHARKNLGVIPFVKKIDTLAAEFPAETNYLYTTYNGSTHDVKFDEHGVIVIGSGVYRIGSSVEFDWSSVSTTRSLRDQGHRTIIINSNPETVSTDFDECHRLYFEEVSLERVLDIYELEQSSGCIVSVGGQGAQNIAIKLFENGAKVLGTSPIDVDSAEDREKFSMIMDRIGVDQPEWKQLTTVDEAYGFADRVGYPVLVRPSYVLSGAAMNVAYTKEDLGTYLLLATDVSPDHPIVITKFIQGSQELDVDAVASQGKLLVYAVSQHIENAGVHSGDATLVLPPIYTSEAPNSKWKDSHVGILGITKQMVAECREIAVKVADAFSITGPFNMQIILTHEGPKFTLKVIECNLRASRSFPFVSKVLNLNFINIATHAIMKSPELDGLIPKNDLMTLEYDFKAVKTPIFSWTRLAGADPMLGVEMASTGEVACFGKDLNEALLISLYSSHNNFKHLPMTPKSSIMISADHLSCPKETAYVCDSLHDMGYRIIVDDDLTASILLSEGIEASKITVFPVETTLFDTLNNLSATQKIFEEFGIEIMISFCRVRPRLNTDCKYLMRRTNIDLGNGFVNDSKNAVVFVDALKAYVSGGRTKKEAVKSAKQWLSLS